MLIIQSIIIVFILAWAAIITKANQYSFKKISNPTAKLVYFLPVFFLVFLFTVLRGVETGIDYSTYLEISDRFALTPFDKIWDLPGVYMEPFLILILKWGSSLNLDLLPFITITTTAVLAVYVREFLKDSKIGWLSTLLLFTFGSYFFIFNGIAQFVICTLAFGATTYLYKGKFIKYLIAILIISLIHKTALFMIPMYFILRHKVTDQSHRKTGMAIFLIFSTLITFTFFSQILSTLTPILFPEYANRSFDAFSEVSVLIIARPLIVAIFLLMNIKYIDFNNIKERVWFNASIIALIITILSIQLGPIQRFSYFLLPYMTLQIPNIINKIPSKRKRDIYIILTVAFLILYVILTNLASDPGYTFLWQK